ncbi:hypothetical protein Kole_0072 [Kosmotoga olearia TBF 19.5.1]|uniref:Uncharacterized protein n=1 Tax=Kosmotoga olearia (strain ATCC BAA-1733 / DSM 21960 / TBF 19.5.1) TaxID=521045 RepID=C5CHU4_KOSOT|nr:hypothetical protein Kole_0072 [Kosmotoga olearia TBF 19.5.1]
MLKKVYAQPTTYNEKLRSENREKETVKARTRELLCSWHTLSVVKTRKSSDVGLRWKRHNGNKR